MPNLFQEFRNLLPKNPQLICTVVAEFPAVGVSTVSTVDGGQLRVFGAGGRAAGARVVVQDGRIVADVGGLSVSAEAEI